VTLADHDPDLGGGVADAGADDVGAALPGAEAAGSAAAAASSTACRALRHVAAWVLAPARTLLVALGTWC
jgi:hypothetical protein